MSYEVVQNLMLMASLKWTAMSKMLVQIFPVTAFIWTSPLCSLPCGEIYVFHVPFITSFWMPCGEISIFEYRQQKHLTSSCGM